MASYDLEAIVAHGRRELHAANNLVITHVDRNTVCATCNHAFPCEDYNIGLTYSRYWRLRLVSLESKLAKRRAAAAEVDRLLAAAR